MRGLLEKVDIYGAEIPINVFGAPKVKTACGGILSLFTYIIIGFITFLFGSDFIYKTNPRVVDSEEVPSKSKHLELDLDKIAFMVRINRDGDSKAIDYINSPLNFINAYAYLQVEQGALTPKAFVFSNSIKCSQTKAANIESFKKLNLDEWMCPNWEEIKNSMRTQLNDPDFEIKLGGTLDEDEMFFFNFSLENTYIDSVSGYKVAKKNTKETKDFVSKSGLMLTFYYPTAMYDAKSFDQPIKTTHYSFIQDINANTWFRNDLTFKTLTSEDDKGPIFKQISYEDALIPAEVKSTGQTTRFISDEFILFNFFYIILGKEQKIKSRSYMKLQELSAIVGGVIKFVFVAFGQLGKTVAKFQFLLKAIDLFYKKKVVHTGIAQLSPNVNSFVGVNTSQKLEEPNKLGFLAYHFNCLFRLNEEEKNNVLHYKAAEREIEKQLDVVKLLELYSKFDLLCNLVLNEEQKNQLIEGDIEATN